MENTTHRDTPSSRTYQPSSCGRIFKVPGGAYRILYSNLFTIEVYKDADWQNTLNEMEEVMLREYPQAKSFHDEEISDYPLPRIRRHYARDGQLDFIPAIKP